MYYSSEWKNYRLSANILNNVCAYFNSRRVKAQAYTVEQTAVEAWREHMFDPLNEKVSNAAIEMLERNRNGEIINTYAIKDVIQSYIDLGTLQSNDPKDLKDTKESKEPIVTDDLKVMLCGDMIHDYQTNKFENSNFSPMN